MVIAFLAIVLVQWLWIEHVVEERKNRFSTSVYEVLNRAVARIDEVNYTIYCNNMYNQLEKMQDYQNKTCSSASLASKFSYGYLSEMISHDILRNNPIDSNSRQSYLICGPRLNRKSKTINKNMMTGIINSMKINDTIQNNYKINAKFQQLFYRLIREKDPENMATTQRLENINIKNELSRSFKRYSINIPFTYSIFSNKDIFRKVKSKDIDNLFYVNLFPRDLVKKDIYLAVQFSSVDSVILNNMGWMFLASTFCILGLLGVFIVSIIIIMRQQKLSVVKNDFINNMTHEFKTPIATISLATSAIQKDKVIGDKNAILKFNSIIKVENNRMNKYVERILQQAKLSKKVMNLNLVQTDLNQLVRESAELFSLQIQDKGGKLKYDIMSEPFLIEVDEVHMMNCICNLIDNAIKYSKDKLEILISTKVFNNQFVISVKDNGIGIDKEDQKNVFKRFYRVHSGNIHTTKGFGLGLSYVKAIVQLHHGNVKLKSKKGEGTLVQIILMKEI